MNTPPCQQLTDETLLTRSLHPSKHSSFRAVSVLKQLWQFCRQIISAGYEPSVWHRVDRQGRITSWHVFDPESGRTITFGSELEVRLWLEQRYYR